MLEAPAAPAAGLLFSEAGYAKYETKHRQRVDLQRQRDVTHVDSSLADVPGALEAAEAWHARLEDGIMAREEATGDMRRWAEELRRRCEGELRGALDTGLRLSQPAAPAQGIVDKTVPAVFVETLALLREADASGLWPEPSTGRSKVLQVWVQCTKLNSV